jgi:hypothetical protein
MYQQETHAARQLPSGVLNQTEYCAFWSISRHLQALSFWQRNSAIFDRHVHLATPRRTASTVATTVVTQIMFRTFEVTTGKNPDRSGAFSGLAFLRGLPGCRITGSLCAMVIPVSEGLIGYLEWLSLRLSKIADATDEPLNGVG